LVFKGVHFSIVQVYQFVHQAEFWLSYALVDAKISAVYQRVIQIENKHEFARLKQVIH
jgi:hypothetical protein